MIQSSTMIPLCLLLRPPFPPSRLPRRLFELDVALQAGAVVSVDRGLGNWEIKRWCGDGI